MGSALRTHWMLAELGVEYAEMPLNMREREHKRPEFLAINPTGQVPVLIDGAVVLSESLAINEYLGLKFKPEILGETIEDKANAWKWSLWAYMNIQHHLEEAVYQKLGIRTETPELVEKAREHLKPYFEILNKYLEGKKYLLGDKFSVADINAGMTMSYATYSNISWDEYPHIAAWLKLITERPAYLKATTPTA